MARKPESQFITSVHKHLPASSIYKMKNHNPYVGGIADCWYSGNPLGAKKDLWIEYKFIPIGVPRAQVAPALTRQQLNWLQNRHSEGRNIWVVVGCKGGGVILTTPEEFEHGLSAFEFMDRLKDRQAIAQAILDFCNGEEHD